LLSETSVQIHSPSTIQSGAIAGYPLLRILGIVVPYARANCPRASALGSRASGSYMRDIHHLDCCWWPRNPGRRLHSRGGDLLRPDGSLLRRTYTPTSVAEIWAATFNKHTASFSTC